MATPDGADAKLTWIDVSLGVSVRFCGGCGAEQPVVPPGSPGLPPGSHTGDERTRKRKVLPLSVASSRRPAPVPGMSLMVMSGGSSLPVEPVAITYSE